MTIHNSILNHNINADIDAYNRWQWQLDHSPIYKDRYLGYRDLFIRRDDEPDFDAQPFSD